jgi:hypothetical protein
VPPLFSYPSPSCYLPGPMHHGPIALPCSGSSRAARARHGRAAVGQDAACRSEPDPSPASHRNPAPLATPSISPSPSPHGRHAHKKGGAPPDALSPPPPRSLVHARAHPSPPSFTGDSSTTPRQWKTPTSPVLARQHHHLRRFVVRPPSSAAVSLN